MKKLGGALVAGMLIAGLVAFVSPRGSSGDVFGMLDPLAIPFAEDCSDDTAPCVAADHHAMKDGTDFQEDNHDCQPPAGHTGPPCPGKQTFRPVDVWDADRLTLVAMLEAPGTNVFYNQERRAIQVLGCDGESVALHIPWRGASRPGDRES